MIGYVKDYASDKVPILKVPLPSLEIEPEPPGLGPITSNKPESPAEIPAETPEPPPLTQEESDLLDARAFSHRATGKTYRQIARKLNIPSSSAYKRVQREMGRRREEFAEDEADSRELIVALLDGALEAIATQAYDGDLKAFHLLLQYANTRVRLAKIENPKTPDKLIRKLNAAATAYDASATDDIAVEPLPECKLEPVETNPTGEELQGAKSEKGREPGCERDRGQKCGQESQPLAETQVAADEKICAKHMDTHNENINECEARGAIPSEVPGGENFNTLVSPTGAIQGVLDGVLESGGNANWESPTA
ncbi:MAG: helix-turn-helix domain-containing protein [Planctomycetes bacterium]|nr:helix-turn-helix domain-containing protein [Planctomycetota bacterium]